MPDYIPPRKRSNSVYRAAGNDVRHEDRAACAAGRSKREFAKGRMRTRPPLVAANDNFPPRLLTKSQAASYCGLSLPTFSSVCPVRPIALGVGVRMERYDLRELDGWIDGFRNAGEPIRTADKLLDAL